MDEFDLHSSHSAAAVVSNDDLLTEILLCLPVVSILRFKSVSKHWRSLLSHPTFIPRYDTQHFCKSALGLFCDKNQYVPFDEEDRSDTPFHNLDLYSYPDCIRILQSCNGLLFCSSSYSAACNRKYYVFNPTTRQFVIIPSVPGGTVSFMGLAFHQTDCVHYKVVCVLKLKRNLIGEAEELYQIQTYSSDTSEWKISVNVKSFSAPRPIIGSGVYWNGALYWALKDLSYMYFRIDVQQLHALPLPVEAMSSKTLTRYLGESRGHLHLIVYDYERNFLPLKVYEMSLDHSGWFLKFHVELDQLKELRVAFQRIFKPLTIIDVIRGEKDEDTFMVLMINGFYITYNVHHKSFKPISKFNNIDEKMEIHPSPDTLHRYSQTLAFL